MLKEHREHSNLSGPPEQAGHLPDSARCIRWEQSVNLTPEERRQVEEVTREMFQLLYSRGLTKAISYVAIHRPNNDGETPCLVVLFPNSGSRHRRRTEAILDTIDEVYIRIWKEFHPLSWCFATTFADAKPPKKLTDTFLGHTPQLLATVTG